jgi:hypothetical protein
MFKNYRVWHALIDVVGLLSLLMATGYILFSKSLNLPAETLDIWSGLATELLGAWAVARVVEYAIRKNSDYDKVRVRAARNLRFYLNLSNRVIEYGYDPDVLLIQRERNWSRRFFEQHIKCFSKDEIIDLENAYAELDELIGMLIENGDSKEQMYEKLASYEELAFKAECNIFEETPEIV